MMKGLTEQECIAFATQHTYLDYHDVLHSFTFHNLPEEIQSDLLLLDEFIAQSKRYLDDEVTLYELFRNGTLSTNGKTSLVDLIFSRMYFSGVMSMRSGTEKDGFMIGDFFAELPLKEVMNRVAHETGITWKDKQEEDLLDAIEEYAKAWDLTMEHLVREALNSWLEDGLFTTDFAPIYISERFDTWNGNTKKSHKDLFAIWYAEREKSKKYFANLFNTKKLMKQDVEMTFLGERKVMEMIIGESLYACKEDFDFVRAYKEQIKIILPFSNAALFVEKYAKPIRNYSTLCAFKRMAKKAADVFDAEFTKEYDELIDSYKDEVMILTHEMTKLTDAATECLYTTGTKDMRYDIHIVNGRFGSELKEGSESAEVVARYREEFKKLSV